MKGKLVFIEFCHIASVPNRALLGAAVFETSVQQLLGVGVSIEGVLSQHPRLLHTIVMETLRGDKFALALEHL